ncbi:sec-independent protein translocase protein TATB, chloroplastic isoform X2 [Lotus japonicus]|uniref:Sec-independent protein translocase protein TATB, chloroplastic n=1 Tax=Lotus japonicus TaxID=34305 RepID=I3S6U9_LOTJA|nr:sec-independent protein translocase protein TATB, chloroplastic isoform X2 [Lotus japonicus]AFK35991.1 unknown [Lotus japonicus]
MTQSLAMVSSTVLCPKLGACAVSLSPSATPHTKIQRFHLSSWLSPMGRSLFSPWNGLKHLGISTKPKPLFHIDRKGRCKGKLVYASLFGVGAPEALVIGVVALLVFGPKGLAEVARNLGKTLRTFQPTIRELQDVSREFKSTLEREIGLDDISSPTQNPYNSNFQNTTSTPSSTDSTKSSPIAVDPDGTQDPSRAYSSEEYLKITEEQLKASAAQQQQGQTPPRKEGELEPQIQPLAAKETATTVSPPQKPESETIPQDS